MVSFDIVSLFTMIPIDEVIGILFQRLQQDENLEERTYMAPDRIRSLVKLCITSEFENNYYEQLQRCCNGISIVPNISKAIYGRI